MRTGTVVVIPTYNERENLPLIVERLLALEADLDILVVDDNSPDGTGVLADALAERHSRVQVLHRTAREGLGPAYLAGFREALAKGYSVIIQMDADLSHDPQYLPAMLERLKECDLVLGSRYVPGGGVSGWGFFRRMLSRGGSWMARRMLHLPYRDLTGGYKAWRRELLGRMPMEKVRSDGYCFQIEMTYCAHRLGARIAEVPIIFYNRRLGRSKMSAWIIGEAILRLWQLRREHD